MKFVCRGSRGLDSFDKTHISSHESSSHDTNDDGLESTLNYQSKWLMAAFFIGLILWRRDGAASWTAIGSITNFVLSKILKKMFNQQRPVSHFNRSDPGMPSSHSQSIFYTSTLSIISVFQYQGFNGFTSMMLCLLIFLFGSYLSWLRISHQLHTINQVIVGAVIGTAFSVLWLWSWHAFVLNAFTSYSWVRYVVTLAATVYCLSLTVSFSKNFFSKTARA